MICRLDRSRGINGSALCCVGLLVGIAGCQTSSSTGGTYLGKVDAGETYVALGTDGMDVVAYVCDGATVARWFMGSLQDGGFQMTSGGIEIKATLVQNRAAGELTLADGSHFSFELSKVGVGQAGLYRAMETVGDAGYIGGWIVLPDGSQRGAVTLNSAITSTQELDLTSQTVTLSGVGVLQASVMNTQPTGFNKGFNFGC